MFAIIKKKNQAYDGREQRARSPERVKAVSRTNNNLVFTVSQACVRLQGWTSTYRSVRLNKGLRVYSYLCRRSVNFGARGPSLLATNPNILLQVVQQSAGIPILSGAADPASAGLIVRKSLPSSHRPVLPRMQNKSRKESSTWSHDNIGAPCTYLMSFIHGFSDDLQSRHPG